MIKAVMTKKMVKAVWSKKMGFWLSRYIHLVIHIYICIHLRINLCWRMGFGCLGQHQLFPTQTSFHDEVFEVCLSVSMRICQCRQVWKVATLRPCGFTIKKPLEWYPATLGQTNPYIYIFIVIMFLLLLSNTEGASNAPEDGIKGPSAPMGKPIAKHFFWQVGHMGLS